MSDYIILEKDKATAIITISREKALNALNSQVMDELSQAIDVVKADKDIRALIITGAGRAFVAGADIGVQSVFDVREGRQWGRRGSAVFREIELLQIPTIAAVGGFALGGGCELALSCDMIVADEKAKFGQPEVSLGITPGFSGTQRLPRRIGTAKAKEMIFTGRMIDAYEADRIGLINKIAEPGKLMDEAKALAESCIKNAPAALRYAKACIDRGMQTDIDTGIAIENELFAMCFATEDQKEGMKAFFRKEKTSL